MIKKLSEHTPSGMKESPLTPWIPILMLTVGLGVTNLLYKQEAGNIEQKSRRDFSLQKEKIERDIQEKVRDYSYTLRGARALFAGGMNMRESFHGFIEELNIKNKYPGIISVAFIPLVSREDLPHHIQNMKKEGLLDYTIFPSGEMQEYALTSYIEPFDNSQNKKVLGFNSFSDGVRRATMEKARDMNEVQITSNVQLIQENNGESTPGFVMYMPVYRPYNPHTTIEDRRKNGIGWIAATIRTGIFVRGITTEMLHDNELEVEIHDGNTLKTPIIFDNNDATVGAHFYEPKAIFQSTDVLKMFGRSWTIKIHTLPDFELHMKNNTTKVIAISGIIISLFLSIFSGIMIHGRKITMRVAQKMNNDLIVSEQKAKAIMGASMDALVEINKKGEIIEWGGISEKIFGWTREEVIG